MIHSSLWQSILAKEIQSGLDFYAENTPSKKPSEANEQETMSNKMTFNDAIKYSLQNNNNIKALRYQLSSTERDIGIARSEVLPKFGFHEDFVATNNPTDAFALRINQARVTPQELTIESLNYPGAVTNFLTSGVLRQTIFDKKAFTDIKIAKVEYSANGYLYLRKEEELINQVAQAYINVHMEQELIDAVQLGIENTKEHLSIAEVKHKKGTGSYSDVLRAKTALAHKEEKLTSAKRNLEVAKRNLGLLLGLESAVEIVNQLPDITLQDINYYESYSINRNDIKAHQIMVKNAKNRIKSAQALWYPTLNAMASYNFYQHNYPFGGEGNNYITGAFFKWEILDGNKRKYEILKAKDKEAEAKEYLEGLKKSVDFKVFEAYSKVEEARKNLELAFAEKKSAEEDRKLLVKQWADSLIPFVEVTDAQYNLDEARDDVVEYYNALKTALINLAYESGIIAKELGLE